MNRIKLFVFLGMLACIFGPQTASAQTPVNILVVSGNGQVVCECTYSGNLSFAALEAQVTDDNGNGVPYTTVNWNINAAGTNAGLVSTSTTTDANGFTSNNLIASSSLFAASFQAPSQYVISAIAANGATATFTETQSFVGSGSAAVSAAFTTSAGGPVITGTTISGTAGGQGYTYNGQTLSSFRVGVFANAAPLPGVNLRLVNNQTSPSIACATGAGADPGSVLTDSTGYATCVPAFGPATGGGSFFFQVGGTSPTAVSPSAGLLQYPPAGAIDMSVAPGVPTSLTIASGNGQSANAGQPLPLPLVVTVNGQSGALAGQTVNWAVSPAGAATLSGTSGTSDVNGHVSLYVTLASTASGTVLVTASLAGGKIASQTFTITAVPLVSVTALQYVSGNNQSVLANVAFPNPLIVQVNGSSGPLANIPVQFTVTSGSAILSSTSETTASNGQAAVTVTAGGATGSVTIIATAGGYTVTFNLTVSPPGPSLTTGSFVNGADFQPNSLSPCSIATIMAFGLAPSLQGVAAASMVGALPYSLGGDTVTVGGGQAPIYNVANQNGQQQLTFQVPCSVQPGSNQITVGVGAGSASTTINILPASPGIFQTVMSDGVTRAVLVRPDGSFVSIQNPARRGENIIAYVTGLGPTTPSVGTNSLAIPGQTSNANYTVIAGINNAGAPLNYARLSEDLVGVYEVSFQVPSNDLTGTNVVFSVGVAPQGSGTVYYSAASLIPIQ